MSRRRRGTPTASALAVGRRRPLPPSPSPRRLEFIFRDASDHSRRLSASPSEPASGSRTLCVTSRHSLRAHRPPRGRQRPLRRQAGDDEKASATHERISCLAGRVVRPRPAPAVTPPPAGSALPFHTCARDYPAWPLPGGGAAGGCRRRRPCVGRLPRASRNATGMSLRKGSAAPPPAARVASAEGADGGGRKGGGVALCSAVPGVPPRLLANGLRIIPAMHGRRWLAGWGGFEGGVRIACPLTWAWDAARDSRGRPPPTAAGLAQAAATKGGACRRPQRSAGPPRRGRPAPPAGPKATALRPQASPPASRCLCARGGSALPLPAGTSGGGFVFPPLTPNHLHPLSPPTPPPHFLAPPAPLVRPASVCSLAAAAAPLSGRPRARHQRQDGGGGGGGGVPSPV